MGTLAFHSCDRLIYSAEFSQFRSLEASQIYAPTYALRCTLKFPLKVAMQLASYMHQHMHGCVQLYCLFKVATQPQPEANDTVIIGILFALARTLGLKQNVYCVK